MNMEQWRSDIIGKTDNLGENPAPVFHNEFHLMSSRIQPGSSR
jgi:hypothetical protein